MKIITPWIQLQVINFSESESKKIHGESVKVVLSPNYHPGAIRLITDDNMRMIEFDYPSSEFTFQGRYSDAVEIIYGKRSLKIHALNVELECNEAGKLILQADTAIKKYYKIQSEYNSDMSSLLGEHCTIIVTLLRQYVATLLKIGKNSTLS